MLARAEFLTRLRRLSEEWQIDLPKGASPPVIVAGKRFVAVTDPGSSLEELGTAPCREVRGVPPVHLEMRLAEPAVEGLARLLG